MKGSWISPKVRERHIVCNILLGVFFAPLIIIDLLGLSIGLFICIIYLVDLDFQNFFQVIHIIR